MYKSRFGIWAIIIVLAIIINNHASVITFIKNSMTEREVTVYVDTDSYPTLGTNLNGYKRNHVKWKTVTDIESAEVVISQEEKINGFTKYEDYFSSPIIVTAPKENVLNASDIVSYNGSFTVDVYAILVAVENDKIGTDLGIDSEEKIKLVIPSESSPYYNDVVKFIYFTLNKYKDLTEEEVKSLTERVNKIIAKCETYSSLNAYVDAQEEIGKKQDIAFVLCPEFDAIHANYNTQSDSYGYEYAYPISSTAITYNLFIKEETDISADNVTKSLTDKKFLTKTYIRSKNVETPSQTWDTGFGYYMSAPSIKKINFDINIK